MFTAFESASVPRPGKLIEAERVVSRPPSGSPTTARFSATSRGEKSLSWSMPTTTTEPPPWRAPGAAGSRLTAPAAMEGG